MIKLYPNLIQGTDEWFAARCGLLTASEMKHIITPKTLKYAQNDKEKAHLYELLSQRITQHVEPHYISDDMLRGQDDESYAKNTYHETYAHIDDMGFITNDKWGFTLGFSPDALVGTDGILECKSRRQKFQIETIITDGMPDDYRIQVQTGLLVSERKWCDFISYCAGLPMATYRVEADPEIQQCIIDAATVFHTKLDELFETYQTNLNKPFARLVPTERRIEQEITL